ncbi:hypothetical protein SIL85_14850 [Shewanella oneidensis]|uniref:Type I pilus assembly chaperone CooB n=1 Tax=Shewanella oneidensis (strain ATCC 700550 / JCM 31522 / CIP 106686 / LMG 19005 / NCIMB 14063 / MR-1) TaxID=211586 RepID=Q8E955_SHEON|nr:hypothetical protein [Shewanella oneidensis]AAN57399.1 type I pilus assembly chaperone CooB [Shewanella oneidensis MR-1]MDX5998299.1 hypothetical protein [Shewanella oneidensis]MEE2030457.1 hypothetical protein [Shewanella oneidensis]
MRLYLALFGIIFYSSQVYAAAEISIGTLFDYMPSNKTTYLKKIMNMGDSTAFIKISINEIKYDENGQPYEVPEQEAENRALIASPSRLIIPAKGVQATRLLFLDKKDTERYFRVRFIPVQQKDNDGFDEQKTEQKTEQIREELSAGIQILTGYGAFLFITPDNPKYSTEITEDTNSAEIKNNGNTTIILDFFESCNKKKQRVFHCDQIAHLTRFKKTAGKK